MIYNSTHRGYTLLFATLTAAVVLNIAIFITSVSRKQYILSSTARDSLFAVYNADSAIDCAASSWYDASPKLFPDVGSFRCNNTLFSFNIDILYTADGWTNALRSADIIIPFVSDGAKKGCAIVTFIRGKKDDVLTGVVEALGYNLGDDNTCPETSPRTVERAIRVIYKIPIPTSSPAP